MRRLWIVGLIALGAVGTGAVAPGAVGAEAAGVVAPVLWQPSMNVFRRFAVEPATMYAFYGDVLAFEQLTTFNVGGPTGVARFQAGGSELKLTGRVEGKRYVAGGVADATGLRLLTFFFPDEAALSARFATHGLPAPEFGPAEAAGRRRAFVRDPDGQAVELVVIPGAPEAAYHDIEVGLTVADIESSRAFYAGFVGLVALAPEADTIFGGTKHSYRHGSTIVTLRTGEGALPADTGSGGIQYVVSNVDLVDALARERGIAVDQPLSTLGGFDLRTIWLMDPDGITNYFAETAQARAARP